MKQLCTVLFYRHNVCVEIKKGEKLEEAESIIKPTPKIVFQM